MRIRAAAAAAAIALLSAAPAYADDDVDPAPPSSAVTPGAGIGLYDGAGKPAAGCTLGFLATGADGIRYAYTAGHCNKGGGAVLPYQAADNYRALGRFAHAVNDGPDGPDIAVIRLDDTLPHDARVLSRRPVTAVIADISTNDTLCFYGMRSGGHPHCGRVTQGSTNGAPSRVRFAAVSVVGDSGSPVYRIERDGNATAVAILDGGDSSSSTATLIKPFLDKWHLSLTCQTIPTTTTECHA